MTNMGAHGLDQIQWALGMDDTGPVEFWPVTAGPTTNGKVSFRYANGVQVDLELEEKHGPDGGAIFTGEKGKIEINRNKFTTNPKDLIKDLPPEAEVAKWRDEIGALAGQVSHGELAGLHQDPPEAGRRRGDRPPLGHRLPPGQHRPRGGPQDQVGPEQGADRRRRGSQPLAQPSAPQGLRVAGTRCDVSYRHLAMLLSVTMTTDTIP